jgi:hypothetical protein
MRLSLVRTSLLLAAACALAGTDALAQAPRRVASAGARETTGRQTADSAAARRDARTAQAAFERLRLRHLPWTQKIGAGVCDEHIGRFCLTYDDRSDEYTPPPEEPALARARDELIRRLDDAALRSPRDGWVAAQRVRYLVEARRAGEAHDAARAFAGEAWWRAALMGYALHAAGDHPAAEAAFAAAMETMPDEERRRWTDLAPVLEGSDARELRRMAGPEREAAARRLWWLADPFWMDEGNDRLTEHLARLVADELQERARNVEGLSWGSDLREILLRFGEPAGWERMREWPGVAAPPSLVTHHASPAWEFLPRLSAARGDPAAIPAGAWRLDDRAAPTTYRPWGAKAFAPLEHQLAAFRREDGVEVVAAFALGPDSLPPTPDVEAALVLARDESSPPAVAGGRFGSERGVIRMRTAPEAGVVSVEARERTSRRAARARYGVDLTRHANAEGLALSDVLLLADPSARPATLDEAAAGARAGTAARPGERLALFWELYGAEGEADTLTYTLSLAPAGRRGAAPVRMRWRAGSGGAAVQPRALGVALPVRLRPGPYRLELTVRAGGRAATAMREITVERARR